MLKYNYCLFSLLLHCISIQVYIAIKKNQPMRVPYTLIMSFMLSLDDEKGEEEKKDFDFIYLCFKF